MVNGMRFSLSSFPAISSGSVSPSSCTNTGAFMLICSARVPRMRARSYLVMYGVVVRSVTAPPPCCGAVSRMSMPPSAPSAPSSASIPSSSAPPGSS